jgi:hypothetical protein
MGLQARQFLNPLGYSYKVPLAALEHQSFFPPETHCTRRVVALKLSEIDPHLCLYRSEDGDTYQATKCRVKYNAPPKRFKVAAGIEGSGQRHLGKGM